MIKTGLVGATIMAARRAGRPILLVALGALVSACDEGRDLSPRPEDAPESSTVGRERDNPNAPSVFGDDGITIGTIANRSTGLFGLGADEGDRLPVNKYLWQASLDTLSFLPLASTDPFTGVIATEWGSSPDVPGERLKVSAFITSPALSAASLKVAVYREVQNEEGAWVPAAVDPETPRKLEDAILTRAREIRIAEREGRASG